MATVVALVAPVSIDCSVSALFSAQKGPYGAIDERNARPQTVPTLDTDPLHGIT